MADYVPYVVALSAFGAFMVSFGAFVMSIVAANRSRQNSGKIDTLTVNVDGRLSELLALTRVSSKAEGVKEELERDKNVATQ